MAREAAKRKSPSNIRKFPSNGAGDGAVRTDAFEGPPPPPSKANGKGQFPSLFGHMYQRQHSLVDLRRRAVSLIDVVAERHANGPLKPARILAACAVLLVYWYVLLPAIRARASGVRLDSVSLQDARARAGGPWAEVRWEWAAGITAVYLLGVLAGVQITANRPPISGHVFEYMLIYNIAQVIVNAVLSFNLWREAYQLGFPYPWGNSLDASPAGHRLGMLLWVHYHCKQLELLDTVFVILRKKFQRMSFLHIYLRLAQMWGWFIVCHYACGGDSYFPAAVSSSCQVIVYLYYSLSMINERGVPLVRRALVTEVQVSQFVLCATHASYVLAFGHLPRMVAAISLAVSLSGLWLYVEWSHHQAHFGPRNVGLSMFGHMFDNKLVDLRRRAMTLIDVVAERQLNGPLMPHRLLGAFATSLVYWYFILPACLYWGTGHWYSKQDKGFEHTRAGGPWAEVRWSIAIVITTVYLCVVFAGVRIMDRRPPARRRVFEFMFICNATQVMLNAFVSFSLWRVAWNIGFTWGNELDASSSGHHLGMLLWLHYHCQQLELLDTVFVIARKKFHSMSFFQIILRLVHMWGWFLVCRYACGGDSYFPAAVNCTCQLIVRLYYMVSLIDERGVPLARKAMVTEIQVVQFIICSFHACYIIYLGNLPRLVSVLFLLVMAVSLTFYADFTGDTSATPQPGKVSSTEEDENVLNFRFDSSGWFYLYHFGVAHFLIENVFPEGWNSTAQDAQVSPEQFPKGLVFSGSSGGALVASCMATAMDVRQLSEFVLGCHPHCRLKPWKIFTEVEKALDKYLPSNAAKRLSGRLRVLMTRVSTKPPFFLGVVVDQFSDYSDAYAALRSTCHVPGLNPLPYKFRGGFYYDGMLWSSLFVPWSGVDSKRVVKVSATGTPLTDIRSPFAPFWWAFLPPSVDVLRGMFWVGYRDALQFFAESPLDPNLCGCRAQRGQQADSSASPIVHTAQDGTDPLSSSRFLKHAMARRLLARPAWKGVPEIDPLNGRSVQELIDCYYRGIEDGLRFAAWVSITILVACGAIMWAAVGAA